MADKKLINNKIYNRIAEVHSISFKDVRSVMEHVGDTIKEVIEEDDFNKSVKLDYIGNIYTNPKRREIITIKRENKEKNGRLANISRG